MISILWAKLRLFVRKPLLLLSMTAMSLVFAFLMGTSEYTRIMVPVYSNTIDHLENTELMNRLNQSESFNFKIVTEEEAKKTISEGDVEAGIELSPDSYKLIIAAKTANLPIIQNYVQSVYSDLLLEDNLRESLEGQHEINPDELIESINETSIFTVEVKSFRGADTQIYDNNLQTIFGLSLFFVIYTISYNVLQILQEKQQGVWDRLILSPLRKWQMYAGNLLYSFTAGYIQVVLIFMVFQYLVGVDFHGGFTKTLIVLIPYVFSIVALSMFVVSLVKNSQMFQAVIPFMSVGLSMIGGAYWPIEIVSSEFLLQLAKFDPILYGMEALKGVTIYGASVSEMLYPMSILVLIGVVFIGIGINLMERRSV